MLNGLALCAGAGGLELGLKLALGTDYRTVGYVEREAFAAATLVARMEDKALDCAPVWDDLKTFDGRVWRGYVDLVSGGYPCQPFSAAGRRLGASDPRHLWPHIARIVQECRPSLVFCENVDAHLRLGFEQVRGDLLELGYKVEAGIFSAAEMGAPHLRKRLFFLAHAYSGGFTSERRGSLLDGERPPHWDNIDGRGGSSMAYAQILSGQDGPATKERLAGSPGGGVAVSDPGGVDGGEVFAGWGHPAVEEPGVTREAWPPARTDIDGWERVLSADPSLEPAVRGMANGVADRVDRLRAAGNGVVPVVAAVAFVALWRRLNAREP